MANTGVIYFKTVRGCLSEEVTFLLSKNDEVMVLFI